MAEMTSNTGVLKMVRVNKGENNRQSRSLVFRISRTAPKSSFDDSGIQCNSPEGETSSDDSIENYPHPLKIKIPKSVLNENNKEPKSSCHLTLENENEPLTFQNVDRLFSLKNEDEDLKPENEAEHSKLESVDDNFATGSIDDHYRLEKVDENFTLRTVDNNFTLKNVHENVVSSNFNMDLNYKNVSSTAETQNVSNPVFETGNTKSYDLRSSRRILLRLQKDCQSVSSMNQASNIENPTPVLSSCSAQQYAFRGCKRKRGRRPGPRGSTTYRTSNIDKLPNASFRDSDQLVSTSNRRKRGRRAGPRVEVWKRRAYTRRGRGRLPKFQNSSIQRNFGVVNPITAGNEKLLFPPPKNSVWTLVPKKLLEFDFFKAHVITIGSSTAEKQNLTNFSTPTDYLSSAVTLPVPFNKENRLERPKIVANTVLQKSNNGLKDYKRPTVIYFKPKNKKFEHLSVISQQTALSIPKPLFNSSSVTKAQNDLLYLYNKYRLLENAVVKKYYESANGDLNETENMISDLLSRTKEVENSCVLENNVTDDSSLDFGSGDAIYLHSEDGDISSLDDVDTLSRGIIIESLRILYSEEAVLS